MLLVWMQSILGQLGVTLLKFYEANSLWLNLIVVAYGAWVVLSWMNLKNIRSALIRALAEQIQSETGEEKKERPALIIPWERVVGQARFPFVAQQSALVPRRLSIQTVQAMLPVEDLSAEAVRATERGANYEEHNEHKGR